MKKYLFVFLILLLLTGCNVQNSHYHIECEECGKCIAEDCIGLEEERCQGHQPAHVHSECEECGKCIAKDCGGLEEERCQGYEFSHTHEYVEGICNCGELEQKNYYFLTFDTDGGSIIETVLLYEGDTILVPSNPINVGYTFKGWSPNLPEVMPESNLEVKAIWEPITYIVTFNNIDGALISTITVSYGEKINTPTNPSMEGYKFIGWYYGEQLWDFETKVKCNVELYARWEKIRGHSHMECQECGKCIAKDCDGLEEERCQGCIIVNLVDKTYVSYLWEDDPSKGQDSIIINTFDEYISFVNKYCLMGFEYGEICGLHYEDHYYSIINDYDENYFEQNSLIFIYVGFLHSRENPKIVHKVDYVDNELIVNLSVTFDSFSKDFRTGLFFNIEVSKYVIENYQNIKYTGNKIVIYD